MRIVISTIGMAWLLAVTAVAQQPGLLAEAYPGAVRDVGAETEGDVVSRYLARDGIEKVRAFYSNVGEMREMADDDEVARGYIAVVLTNEAWLRAGGDMTMIADAGVYLSARTPRPDVPGLTPCGLPIGQMLAPVVSSEYKSESDVNALCTKYAPLRTAYYQTVEGPDGETVTSDQKALMEAGLEQSALDMAELIKKAQEAQARGDMQTMMALMQQTQDFAAADPANTWNRVVAYLDTLSSLAFQTRIVIHRDPRGTR